MIKKSRRHTIQDGQVITFAEDFREEESIFGTPRYEPLGPIVVSASRNEVSVHVAHIRGPDIRETFEQMLNIAWEAHKQLVKCNGRPEETDKTPQTIQS